MCFLRKHCFLYIDLLLRNLWLLKGTSFSRAARKLSQQLHASFVLDQHCHLADDSEVLNPLADLSLNLLQQSPPSKLQSGRLLVSSQKVSLSQPTVQVIDRVVVVADFVVVVVVIVVVVRVVLVTALGLKKMA